MDCYLIYKFSTYIKLIKYTNIYTCKSFGYTLIILFIRIKSILIPPLNGIIWPSNDVPPPYGIIGIGGVAHSQIYHNQLKNFFF